MANLLTPNAAKSMAITTKVMIHATAATNVPMRLPNTPPNAQIAAMNARPQAIGCRTKAFVRALAESAAAELKGV